MDEIDLTNILNNWPYEPGNVNVRLIKAHDGRPIIQLRIDLGILQMEVRNRPDGKKPYDFPSLLDYHIHQIQQAQQEQESGNASDNPPSEKPDSSEASEESPEPQTNEIEIENGDADADADADAENNTDDEESHLEITFEDDDQESDEEADFDEPDERTPPLYTINPDDCRAIREEAVQYYHRYIAFYALDEFDAVFDDATHNLQLIDICLHFAEAEHDRESMEQLRLHTMMTRTRARAAAMTAQGNTREAIEAIDQGIAEIAVFLESVGMGDDEFDEVGEVQVLRSMRDALIPKLPGSQKIELQNRLRAALDSENYELAAILRDEIRMMKD